jgi:hypothetical protein
MPPKEYVVVTYGKMLMAFKDNELGEPRLHRRSSVGTYGSQRIAEQLADHNGRVEYEVFYDAKEADRYKKDNAKRYNRQLCPAMKAVQEEKWKQLNGEIPRPASVSDILVHDDYRGSIEKVLVGSKHRYICTRRDGTEMMCDSMELALAALDKLPAPTQPKNLFDQ